jgi:hypothetical protein
MFYSTLGYSTKLDSDNSTSFQKLIAANFAVQAGVGATIQISIDQQKKSDRSAAPSTIKHYINSGFRTRQMSDPSMQYILNWNWHIDTIPMVPPTVRRLSVKANHSPPSQQLQRYGKSSQHSAFA